MPSTPTQTEAARELTETESKRKGEHGLFICERLHISHFNQLTNTYHMMNQGLYTPNNLQSESESESESESDSK